MRVHVTDLGLVAENGHEGADGVVNVRSLPTDVAQRDISANEHPVDNRHCCRGRNLMPVVMNRLVIVSVGCTSARGNVGDVVGVGVVVSAKFRSGVCVWDEKGCLGTGDVTGRTVFVVGLVVVSTVTTVGGSDRNLPWCVVREWHVGLTMTDNETITSLPQRPWSALRTDV